MSNRILLTATLVVVAVPCYMMTAQTAIAQTAQADAAAPEKSAENSGLEEIVVTARRKEESLLNVPVSVAVVSSGAIQDAGIQSIESLTQFTPGLFAESNLFGSVARIQVQLTFRGLSTDNGISFIDGAPYTGTGQPDVTDVERVEVLEGPQSVYFGRSTFAGAVNYVTRAPSDTFKGQVSEDLSTYNGFDTRLSLEGPLLSDDLLTARINVHGTSTGGQWQSGTSHTQLGEQSTKWGSLTLASSPTPNLKLSAFYGYSLIDDGPDSTANIEATGPGINLNCNLGGTGGPYWCGKLPTAGQLSGAQFGTYATMDPNTYSALESNVDKVPTPFSTRWLNHFGAKLQVNDMHVKADYQAPGGWEMSLLGGYSNTQYADIIGREGFDTSATTNPYRASGARLAADCAAPVATFPFNACYAPQTQQLTAYRMDVLNDYNAELRLSSPSDRRLRGTVGVSYFGDNSPLTAGILVADIGIIPSLGGSTTSSVNTPAVFGGMYYDITDQLTLGAEGRYQWDQITQQQVYPTDGAPLSHTFTSFSPRVSLDYKLTAQQSLYATYAVGYKPGGFNAGLVGLPASELSQLPAGTGIAYAQEKLANYEIGHKARWLDNHLQTTLALYWMKWMDGQVSTDYFVTQPTGGTSVLTLTRSVGRVDLKGLEFQADYLATEHLTLSGSVDYANNKIIDYVYVPGGPQIRNSSDVTGNQLAQTPQLKSSLSATYQRSLAGSWDWYTRVDDLYRGKIFVDPTNVAWIGASNTVNLRFGAKSDHGLKFEAYVNNLFDNLTLTEASQIQSGYLSANPAAPCPPCVSAAYPPIAPAAVGSLNVVAAGLPLKRVIGLRGSYSF